VPGFAIDPDESPVRDAAPTPGGIYRMLGSRMRVLTEGFVGRRRELQALGRILRHGRWTPHGEAERAVAGALVVGMKGQGKSCLVGRALDRHQQDTGELSLVVLHGKLDELQLIEAFRTEAVRLGDDAAERTLNDTSRTAPQRIERLLRHHWRERRLVIVLDDFEQNLEIPGVGEARLAPLAAALLEVLLPVCRDEQPKLLVTSTARFALPAPLAGALADLPLGALDGASVRKLWARGRSAELASIAPNAWSTLCERFGRNARILDWARQLLGGKTPDEVRKVMAEAGMALPVWKDQPLDEAKSDDLVATFLRHMAFEDAEKKVGPDAMTFIDRARVYEVPVPVDAFAELTAGLAVALDRHVPALANLSLLEIGTEEGRAVYRVSPLVKPAFDAADGETWHGVAAEYWWKAAAPGDGWSAPGVLQAWEHALAAKRQDIADQAADLLSPWLDRRGTYAHSAALGVRHVAVFPDSVAGLHWAGHALFRAGDPREGRRLLERAVELASSTPEDGGRRGWVTDSFARVLASLGEYPAAARYFAELVAAEENLHPDGSVRLGVYLHELAGVLRAQGELAGARARLERSLDIEQKVHGTEDHPDVAASLHELAGVLLAQGDLAGARARLERSLAIEQKVHGTEDHPDLAASLHELARVLRAQGDLAVARARLERSLEIDQKVHGTQYHPDVAASLHELAGVLLAEGDLAGARAHLERALAIKKKVYGTEDHPDIATIYDGLGNCLRGLGIFDESERAFRNALSIREKVFGTRDHYMYAETEFRLATLLFQRGRPDEAHDLVRHSVAVLQAQVPSHPILAMMRGAATQQAPSE
jgi:tetratricopeptide (TPR) repeat protein